ncbi:MAG: cysteine hydrolase [Pseudomonadota bacterium]|jgi:nicotinamidase-related amidase|nr:cysteine hydrolase [Pseudomonadota bacterium]MEC8674381.1 cysteine hydrolase [Pseudomonadota bacterium]
MTLLPPPATTAFVIVDMQNDFVHPDGAYGRAGKTAAAIAALPARHRKLAKAMRAAGGWIVSTHFTLVPGRDGEPFMSPHLKNLRPFLGRGDFAPGSFGHELIADLQPSDLQVEKVAFSAFYQSRMEWMLARAGIRTLIFGGIVTNGGVASTVRDAHVRDFHTIVLADGCAAFSQSAHEASIAALATISEIATVEEMVAALGG